ncbi:protein of unknown function [Cyanobium sp. NIES-981]|nr:protein of unknown function [Cyanobium sp. NIES-981]
MVRIARGSLSQEALLELRRLTV